MLLEGDTLTDTGISFPFRRPVQFQKVCDLALTDPAVVGQLEEIVKNHYWYHLLIDELPLFGMIGEYITADEMKLELAALSAEAKATGKPDPNANADESTIAPASFIYTHRDYSISFNGAQIIEVNLTSENPRPLTLGVTYPITYSVTWQATPLTFESRFDRYLDYDYFSHQIHWFAILNSFMMVLFLCGLVLLVLSRTIKTSISGPGGLERILDAETGSASYHAVPSSSTSRDFDSAVEETGWKLLVGDVFRAPNHLMLYSAVLGTGVQLFVLLLAVLVLALLVTYYDEDRGLLTSLFLFIYSLTSGIQGAVQGWFYKLHGGRHWKRALWIGAALYPAFILFVVVALNTFAVCAGSHGVLSFSTTAMVILVWACISVPLTVAGTIWARSRTQTGIFPCRVNAIKRLIPSESVGSIAPVNPASSVNAWYSHYWLLVAMSGILPFGSIFIEMYFVFTSFWNYQYVYVYGFLFLVFIILVVVTVCVAIVSTYVLLNSESWKWAWFSFLASASSCVYVAAYAAYFFHFKSNMTGALQTAYYTGVVGVGIVTLALITGSIGALGTRLFITKIYTYTKAD